MPNSNNVKIFLDAIWKPGEVREIRMIDHFSGKIYFGYFDNPQNSYSAIEKGINGYFIYTTLNPCIEGCKARAENKIKQTSPKTKATGDQDICELDYLLIDCDPKRPSDVSSTNQELNLAKAVSEKIISENGKPLIYGMSGNGYHCIYKHNLKENAKENVERLKNYLDLLNKKFGNNKVGVDLKVFNPSRITKVLGTWALKGESTADRPHRQSYVIAINKDSVTLQIPEIFKETVKPTTKYSNKTVQDHDSEQYLRRVIELNPQLNATEKQDTLCKLMFNINPCLFDPNHKGKEASLFVASDCKTIGYQCFHDSCKGKTWNDAKQLLTLPDCTSKEVQCSCGFTGIWVQEDVSGKWRIANQDGVVHICDKKKPKQQTEQNVQVVEQEIDIVTEPPKKDAVLDTEGIHPTFAKFWNNYEHITEASRDYVLPSLLTSMSGTIGNKVVLKIANGIKPNIYTVLLGKSTFMRKTTSMDIGAAALFHISGKKKDTYIKEVLQYKDEMELYNAFGKKEKTTKEKPKIPEDFSNIYPNELSPQQLIVKMTTKPDGIFIHSELGSLLSRFESGFMAGFKENLTDFFDGRKMPWVKENKIGLEIFKIENPAPSLLACSTLEWLNTHLDDTDLKSGFLGRFLFVNKNEYPDEPISVPPYYTVTDEFIRLFELLDAFQTETILSTEAYNFYDEWYKKTREWAIKQDRLLHSFLGRMLNVPHKIALINHTLDCLANSRKKPTILEKISYEQAMPWVKFFTENILSCYYELTQPNNIKEERILEVIRRRGKEDGKHIFCSQSILCMYANLNIKELKEALEILYMKQLVVRMNRGKYTYYAVAKS